MRSLFRFLILVLSMAVLLPACGGGGGGGSSTPSGPPPSSTPANIGGQWHGVDSSGTNATIDIYQWGSNVTGQLVIVPDNCFSIIQPNFTYENGFTGTVSGSTFTLTGALSTWTVTGSVTGHNMQVSWSTTANSCVGQRSGPFTLGFQFGLDLTSVSVTPANPTISVGATQQFAATANFSDGTKFDITNHVTWTSSAPSVATINSSGLATTVAAGTTTITAAAGSIPGSTTLTVGATTSSPVITSVSQILPQKTQTITITGSGFGTMAPYTGDSPYIKISDNSASPIWSAGYSPTGNLVWLSIGSWSDSQITITGFAGAYGSSNWVLKSGDQIVVSVWNAQNGNGPGTYTLNVY